MKKISIIIPVYNVEKYLSHCLDSCLEQDLPKSEYEIIIVNDGSPDRSQEIIDSYASKHENIIAIIKENGGLSSARNAGLKIAKGEYIWFVDSDDSIKENCLSEIYKLISEQNIECLTFNYFYKNENENKLKTKVRNLKNHTIYNGLDLYHKGWIFPFSAVQFYIFKHQYIIDNALSFHEGIIAEDWLFTIQSYLKLQKCLYVNKEYYNYYIHGNSISNSGNDYRKGHDDIIICKQIYNQIKNTENKRHYIIYSSICQMLNSIYNHWRHTSGNNSQKLRKNTLSTKFWITAIMRSHKFQYLIIYILLKTNIKIKLR